jgi:hypothetical protein
MAQCIRLNASLPEAGWGECVMTAVFLHNRLPTTANKDNASPYFLLYKKHPDLSFLCIIGCKCYVHFYKPDRKILDPKAKIGTLVGYSLNSKCYRVLFDNKTGTIAETSHIVFAESVKQLEASIVSSGDEPNDTNYTIWIDNDSSSSKNGGNVSNSSSSESLSKSTSKNRSKSKSSSSNTSLSKSKSSSGNTSLSESISTIHNADNSLHIVENSASSESEDDEDPTSKAEVNLDKYLSPALKTNDSLVIRKSNRTIKEPAKYSPPVNSIYRDNKKKNEFEVPVGKCKVVRIRLQNTSPGEIVKCNVAKIKFSDAIKDKRLIESMRKELKSMFEIGAFAIVNKPKGRRAIRNVWVHKLKHGPSGEFLRAKSRICPWVFEQIPFLDYDPDKVAAATLNMESCAIFLAITVERDMITILVDVDGAFQIPECEEDLYTEFPEGMEKIPGKVIKLVHSLNGTKQAAFNWHVLAHQLLTDLGYIGTVSDPCLYFKWTDNKLSLVALYVDDFRCASELQSELDNLVEYFRKQYDIKIQPASWWLGMKVDHDIEAGTLKISHEQYIKDALEQFRMTDCKPLSTPAEPNSKLIKTPEGESDPESLKFPYREAVGKLLWLARSSRPDILYAVNQVGAHCNNPNASHVNATKRIFRYLQGTKSLGIVFRRSGNRIQLEAFFDAVYAGEPEENDSPMGR